MYDSSHKKRVVFEATFVAAKYNSMGIYRKFLQDFKQNYVLMIPLTIILQSCLGSIAAMRILMSGNNYVSFFELTTCVILCMVYNAAILAEMKVKLVFNLLLTTLVVNSIFIIINLS